MIVDCGHLSAKNLAHYMHPTYLNIQNERQQLNLLLNFGVYLSIIIHLEDIFASSAGIGSIRLLYIVTALARFQYRPVFQEDPKRNTIS